MILDFDDFIIEDNEIYNDYIVEKLSVSLDVSDKTDDIVKQINQQLETVDVNIMQTIQYDCADVEKIKLDKELNADIFRCGCKFNVDIYNLHIKNKNNIQTILNNLGYDMNIQTHMNDVNWIFIMSFIQQERILSGKPIETPLFLEKFCYI